MKAILCIVILFATSVSTTLADTIETSIEGLVIKHLRCVEHRGDLYFTLSNRSNVSLSGTVVVTAFDKDNDPIDGAKRKFDMEPVSGREHRVDVKCSPLISHAFRVE